MENFEYLMPVKMYVGEDCIKSNSHEFKNFGTKALVVTGKSSAKANGSLGDIICAFKETGIGYVNFDRVEENPSLETIYEAVEFGLLNGCDFIVGIGGGSPMDASKACAVLMANPKEDRAVLFENKKIPNLPLVLVPTTAGTGSETTPYSVITVHSKKTKITMAHRVFADAAFLDAKYMMDLNPTVTNNTAIDTLSHLLEGYMTKKSNYLSDMMALMGAGMFSECLDDLKQREYSLKIREKLLLASAVAGFVIAQAGTSIVHGMGYFLTYEKNIPHGRANGVLMEEYLKLFPENSKINTFLSAAGFSDISEFGKFLDEVLDTAETFTEEEIKDYTEKAMKDTTKISSHPYPLTYEEIYNVYEKSLIKK